MPKDAVWEIPPAAMTADTISLMRSDRGKRGMIYTEIGCVRASDPPVTENEAREGCAVPSDGL